jgi:DNA repair protein RecN (Recombination protein N)
MLKHLVIQNYALIDHLEIEFHKGLNIITGETGAGKSILLGALGLILGNRAETNILKDKSASCVVEGYFDISGYNLEEFFIQNDIDFLEKTIIRRLINPQGKSRAFVNEIPVTLQLLKDLVSKIIDIHSQHENLLLADSAFQLAVLDSFADNSFRVSNYKSKFSRYNSLIKELEDTKEKANQAKSDLDYLQYQLSQLEDAKLKVGEEEELEVLHQQLLHAEEIQTSLQNVSGFLNDESASVLVWLKNVEATLGKIAPFFLPGSDLSKRVESCRIELKDISLEVDGYSSKVEVDPTLLETVSLRLDLILSLQQKHKVSSSAELIELQTKLRSQVDEIADYDLVIEKLVKEVEVSKVETLNLALEISDIRKKASGNFHQSIKELLIQLGMPYADFKVEFVKSNDLLATGIDKVSFLFNANKQMPLQELSKIASGGELSRLMLSLKSLMVKTKGLPTIILDEIDTGVSGDVADKVGNIINTMADGMQVINITHLPQIACKGDFHFLVYKDNNQETSKTQIKLLSKEERVLEIAKMLSGETISEAALTNAKHLLNNGLS